MSMIARTVISVLFIAFLLAALPARATPAGDGEASSGTPSGDPSVLRLQVRSDVETNDRVIRLGDLVPGAPLEISGLVVADAPAPGASVVLSLADVQRALSRAGHSGYEVGDGRVTVRRAGRHVSRARLAQRLAALIGDRLEGAPVRVTLSGFRPFALPVDANGEVAADYRLSLLDIDETRGRFQARLAVPDGFGGSRMWTLTGRY
ncbi:MAG: hypothetical protein D6757_09255, partial [Alphaproteobacteria bacterium]